MAPGSSFNFRGCPRCRNDTFSPQRGTDHAWGFRPFLCVTQSINAPADVPVRVPEPVVPQYPVFPQGVDCIIISERCSLSVVRAFCSAVDATGLPCLFRGLGFPRYSEFNRTSPCEGAIAYRSRTRGRRSSNRCSGCRSAATTGHQRMHDQSPPARRPDFVKFSRPADAGFG